MSEIPVISPPSPLESPVRDPNLFFLREVNRAFIAGNTVRPQISRHGNDERRQWAWVGVIGVLLLCVVLPRMQRIDMELPPFPTFPETNVTETGMLLFLGVLLLMGIAVVVRDYRLTRRVPPPKAENKEGESPVKAGPAGSVLEGTVVQAEKIRTEGDNVGEKLGVRYQFAAPGGIVTFGYAEGLTGEGSSSMAPVAGEIRRCLWFIQVRTIIAPFNKTGIVAMQQKDIRVKNGEFRYGILRAFSHK